MNKSIYTLKIKVERGHRYGVYWFKPVNSHWWYDISFSYDKSGNLDGIEYVRGIQGDMVDDPDYGVFTDDHVNDMTRVFMEDHNNREGKYYDKDEIFIRI